LEFATDVIGSGASPDREPRERLDRQKFKRAARTLSAVGAGNIRRAWQVKRWLLSLLEFRGRHRAVMTPGHYTELFFLDEATGLAAGHRACFECRRERFRAFQAAWRDGRFGSRKPSLPTAGEMDDRLHSERIGPDGTARTATWRAVKDSEFRRSLVSEDPDLPDPWKKH